MAACSAARRRVSDEPLELMCALILVETLGPAVLVEEPPPTG